MDSVLAVYAHYVNADRLGSVGCAGTDLVGDHAACFVQDVQLHRLHGDSQCGGAAVPSWSCERHDGHPG